MAETKVKRCRECKAHTEDLFDGGEWRSLGADAFIWRTCRVCGHDLYYTKLGEFRHLRHKCVRYVASDEDVEQMFDSLASVTCNECDAVAEFFGSALPSYPYEDSDNRFLCRPCAKREMESARKYVGGD